MSEPPALPRRPASSSGQRFFGALFMTIGGLMATLCGLCTLGFGGTIMVETLTSGATNGAAAAVTGLSVVALIGGVPTLVGALVVFAGWQIWKAAK